MWRSGEENEEQTWWVSNTCVCTALKFSNYISSMLFPAFSSPNRGSLMLRAGPRSAVDGSGKANSFPYCCARPGPVGTRRSRWWREHKSVDAPAAYFNQRAPTRLLITNSDRMGWSIPLASVLIISESQMEMGYLLITRKTGSIGDVLSTSMARDNAHRPALNWQSKTQSQE